MLNFLIDPAVLKPWTPRGVELDAWSGRTYVSVVGFRFLHTRMLGIAIPFHQAFDEVNLRSYVRRRGPEGWRRGVVFVRELVPRPAVAIVARLCYNEPYRFLPMRSTIEANAGNLRIGGRVEYAWRIDRRWNALRATVDGPATSPAKETETEFITEHYWGYSAQRDGGCVEYRVEHEPWRVHPVRDAALECDVARVYGTAFADALARPCHSAWIAEGSQVVVHRGVRIESQQPGTGE